MNPDNLHHFIQDHQADFDSEAPPAGLWDRIEGAIDADDGADTDSDPLREFIVAHRENFDDATPAAAHGRTPIHRTRAPRRRPLAAGCLPSEARVCPGCCRLGTTAGYGLPLRKPGGYRSGQDEQLAHQLENIDPELAETERFYTNKKSPPSLLKSVRSMTTPNYGATCRTSTPPPAQLRAELLEVPLSQRPVLINELIEAYRTKLDILLRIQQHFSNPNPPDGTPRRGANEYSNES